MLMVSPLPLWGSIIKQLIQENLAGPPGNFQVVSWKFDPDAADRRRVEFEQKYGVRGQKLIARLGQGFDGNHEERKLKQIERDKRAGYPHVNDPNWMNYYYSRNFNNSHDFKLKHSDRLRPCDLHMPSRGDIAYRIITIYIATWRITLCYTCTLLPRVVGALSLSFTGYNALIYYNQQVLIVTQRNSLLWNPKVHHRDPHPLNPILSSLNPMFFQMTMPIYSSTKHRRCDMRLRNLCINNVLQS